MKVLLQTTAAALAVIALSSCASSNPASRVASHPALMEGLSGEHRNLVLQGRVKEGMNKDAVFLAWGRADEITRGSEGGRESELWRYVALKPVYHTSIGMSMGFGRGYNRYGRYGRNCGGFYGDPFFETGPDYVPVTAAVVRFRNNKVTSWEAAQ